MGILNNILMTKRKAKPKRKPTRPKVYSQQICLNLTKAQLAIIDAAHKSFAMATGTKMHRNDYLRMVVLSVANDAVEVNA